MNRRLKIIEVSPELLAELVLSDHLITRGDGTEVVASISNCPKDARGVRFGIGTTGNLMLVVEHDSFPEMPEGYILDKLSPLMETRTIDSGWRRKGPLL